MSVMSVVATFTLRDLNRQSAKVLAAVRKYGSAVIKTRAGEVFTLQQQGPRKSRSRRTEAEDISAEFLRISEERAQRFRELGYVQPKSGEWDEERFNRIIAGEE